MSDTTMTRAKQQADQLVDLHCHFILQQLADSEWLHALLHTAYDWLAHQPIDQHLDAQDGKYFAKTYILDVAPTAALRQDIRLITQQVINHPINDDTLLQDIIATEQVEQVADYISSQKVQREALIHNAIGNPAFAKILAQTINHAITDFMDTAMTKNAGVGKLMKFGKGAIEKATKSNLDDGLSDYLDRNIQHLTAKTESIVIKHANNERIKSIIMDRWNMIKNKPVAYLQHYLNDESIAHGEQVAFDGFEKLRHTDYLSIQIDDAINLWFETHQQDTFADIFTALHIDTAMLDDITKQVILPFIVKMTDAPWLTSMIKASLTQFYHAETTLAVLTGDTI